VRQVADDYKTLYSQFCGKYLMFQAGADVNAAKPVTPLIIAARYGLSDCIKCLLKYRADPNIADEVSFLCCYLDY
jgi:ankyrin repeat protein